MGGLRLGKIAFGIMSFFALFLGARIGMAIEETKYNVLESKGDFELRQYQTLLVT
jgi:hypothetical protein